MLTGLDAQTPCVYVYVADCLKAFLRPLASIHMDKYMHAAVWLYRSVAAGFSTWARPQGALQSDTQAEVDSIAAVTGELANK